MPINIMDSFESGYNTRKKSKNAYQYALDAGTAQYDAGVERKNKLKDAMLLQTIKSIPSEKDKAMTRAYDALADQRGGETLSPSIRKQKIKDTSGLYSLVNANKIKREQVQKAQGSLGKIPTGLVGKIGTNLLKKFDPNNPTLEHWQNVKSVLTDAQLLYTAKTKGAISDREMDLFAQAAANDDLGSVARMKPAIDRLAAFIDAEENAQFDAFEQNYQEDPREWFEAQRADSAPDASTTVNYEAIKEKLRKRYLGQ